MPLFWQSERQESKKGKGVRGQRIGVLGKDLEFK